MSNNFETDQQIKVVSSQQKNTFISIEEGDFKPDDKLDEEIVSAPFVENIERSLKEIVDKVYTELSSICEERDLKWEAELDLSLIVMGIRTSAKVKISPKS